MPHELIEAVTDRVATLTLNRPDQLNAFSPAMVDALLEPCRGLRPMPGSR